MNHMEITKTCNVEELNNNTKRPMTLSDFERKYLDPRIRQEYEELEEEVRQNRINLEKAMKKLDKEIEEARKLLAELDDESSNE